MSGTNTFFGAGGLVITDQHRVVIAAAAVRLVLYLDLSFYDKLTEIIVYPNLHPSFTNVAASATIPRYREDNMLLHRILWTLPALILLAVLLAGCEESPRLDPATTHQAIVNGVPTDDLPAVGAITLVWPNLGYFGSYCTGTLIHPEWVVTAAHCVLGEGVPGGLVSTETIHFYIGPDARPNDVEPPLEGRLVAVAATYVHPDYNGATGNDVGLLRLAEPVTDVAPLLLNQQPLHEDLWGIAVRYIGYGATQGGTYNEMGVRREGFMTLVSISSDTYTSQYEGQGVCTGDSGGPGLVEFDGVWTIIGLNSKVSSLEGPNACAAKAYHMRVDAQAMWIADTMASAPPLELPDVLTEDTGASDADAADLVVPDVQVDTQADAPELELPMEVPDEADEDSSPPDIADTSHESTPETQGEVVAEPDVVEGAGATGNCAMGGNTGPAAWWLLLAVLLIAAVLRRRASQAGGSRL